MRFVFTPIKRTVDSNRISEKDCAQLNKNLKNGNYDHKLFNEMQFYLLLKNISGYLNQF